MASPGSAAGVGDYSSTGGAGVVLDGGDGDSRGPGNLRVAASTRGGRVRDCRVSWPSELQSRDIL